MKKVITMSVFMSLLILIITGLGHLLTNYIGDEFYLDLYWIMPLSMWVFIPLGFGLAKFTAWLDLDI